MKKRYQIFVSSTYVNLKKERQAIIESLLKIKAIPVGMEHFTASSRKQWDVIKPLIQACKKTKLKYQFLSQPIMFMKLHAPQIVAGKF